MIEHKTCMQKSLLRNRVFIQTNYFLLFLEQLRNNTKVNIKAYNMKNNNRVYN